MSVQLAQQRSCFSEIQKNMPDLVSPGPPAPWSFKGVSHKINKAGRALEKEFQASMNISWLQDSAHLRYKKCALGMAEKIKAQHIDYKLKGKVNGSLIMVKATVLFGMINFISALSITLV